MRILHCVLILAFAILLKNVCCGSSNPLPNSPLSYLSSLPKPKASSFEVPATNTKLGKVHPQAPAPPPPPPPPSPSKVTSYILAVQWPTGVCTGQSNVTCKIKPVPTEFTIHGLWPQYSAADPPKKSNETVQNQLANITSELNKNWPNLQSEQQQISINLIFWTAEWNKHGSVSEMGVLDYFKKALELFGEFGKGLKVQLAAKNIIPTVFKTYKLADIKGALEKIYGVSCRVICVQSKTSTVQQIQEIRFKFTNDFKKQNFTSTCTATDVRFP